MQHLYLYYNYIKDSSRFLAKKTLQRFWIMLAKMIIFQYWCAFTANSCYFKKINWRYQSYQYECTCPGNKMSNCRKENSTFWTYYLLTYHSQSIEKMIHSSSWSQKLASMEALWILHENNPYCYNSSKSFINLAYHNTMFNFYLNNINIVLHITTSIAFYTVLLIWGIYIYYILSCFM